MRIVTRPDFDGIICAVLLSDALDITEPVKWVEPNAMQHGLIEIRPDDVIANLAYNKNCALWFDHHESNRIAEPFNGVFKIAPSAAGIIFEYFLNDKHTPNPFRRDYTRLIEETDRIDSAALTLDEVLEPEKNPYVALSTTISSHKAEDEPYWNKLVKLLKTRTIEKVLEDPEVKERIKRALEADQVYRRYLENHTTSNRHVTITDFRSLKKTPSGNRFLVFSLFPDSVVNAKIRYESSMKDKVVISIGHSIFNRGCHVSAGEICAHFGGGGHRGAGSCSVSTDQADRAIRAIVDILLKNQASSFPILYEDHFLIAVEKPPGLRSEGRGVVRYKGRLFAVFPLEQEASGVVLFAKNDKVKNVLLAMSKRGDVKRTYYALVQGQPPGEEGTINDWQNNEAEYRDRLHYIGTHYWLLKKFGNNALLGVESELENESQILNHLSQLGCPVMDIQTKTAPGQSSHRLGLHAYFMAFTHPVSQKRIALETPVPQSFLNLLSNFDKTKINA
jgi:23S rRNA-/tRNA-specific pseudouridylate synthase